MSVCLLFQYNLYEEQHQALLHNWWVNTDSITTVALTGLSENLYELQLTQSQLELAERQKRMITNGYIPVSYTHLDVYKRQIIISVVISFSS